MSSTLSKVKTVRKHKPAKNIRRIRLVLLVLGVSLLTAGIFTGSTEKPYVPKATTTEVVDNFYTFASEPVIIDPLFLSSVTTDPVPKNPPVRLLIPDLGI